MGYGTIRLIVSDIDGTMIPEGTSYLKEEYFDVTRALKAKGVRFAAASGRGYESMAHLLSPVLDDIFCLANNGGTILTGGRELATRVLEPEHTAEVMDAMDRMDGWNMRLVHTSDGIYTDCPDPALIHENEQRYDMQLRPVTSDVMRSLSAREVSMLVTSPINQENERLRAILTEAAETVVAGSRWIDIIPRGVSKGWGAQKLMQLLQIDASECISCGDNFNDVPMFRVTGDSYCAAEAAPDVRAQAAHIFGPLSEDPVLQLLKRVLEDVTSLV